ncbi:rRNA methyltransferase [Schizosaccharomyces japonicus yFS275]|uniref:rRNA methyltransferase n=1 Tax=Schizosaccharomyces japonicus (strain yFS275 / FY16936) TaxID=402676 RepID=B6K5A7_SCHJY|nr:rRNA methyltransferase [Schizosaccharomyces japonicus yFS275]EEB08711.1 rRNA methyltransferase [Schizosaccharomyces japonicus yFS275]
MDFYVHAAGVLDDLKERKGSIKQLAFKNKKFDPKRTYALVCETLKYTKVLDEVIERSELLKKEKKLTRNLAIVLVHDLLLTKRGIQASGGLYKDAILRNKTRLNGEFVKYKIQKGAKSNEELALKNPVNLPRWVRVNTILSNKEEVIKGLGVEPVDSIDALVPGKVYFDDCVENLLALESNISFVGNELYEKGKIIIQDKASCFPAAVLHGMPGPVGDIIDGCAAPGNKTTHLAALYPNAKIFAFERDAYRVKTLQKMVRISGAKNVEIQHMDFTHTDVHDEKYANVTHILLDPSCSGSGIVSRQDFLLVNEQDPVDEGDRKENLSKFQSTILKHALSFPNVRNVTYSTCSVHREENEQVVDEVLKQEKDWSCAPLESTLPQWPDRGVPEYCSDPSMAGGMIRCEPGRYGTIGFFVANLFHNKRYAEATSTATRPSVTNSKSKRKRKKKNAKGNKKAKNNAGDQA